MNPPICPETSECFIITLILNHETFPSKAPSVVTSAQQGLPLRALHGPRPRTTGRTQPGLRPLRPPQRGKRSHRPELRNAPSYWHPSGVAAVPRVAIGCWPPRGWDKGGQLRFGAVGPCVSGGVREPGWGCRACGDWGVAGLGQGG